MSAAAVGRGVLAILAIVAIVAAGRIATGAPAAAGVVTDELDALLARLDAADPTSFAATFDELRTRGADAAERALLDFEAQDFAARRARARLVALLAEPTSVPRALELVSDPDALVRESFAAYFGELGLARAYGAERIAALVALAVDDPARRVRSAAARALAASGLEGSAAALDALLDRVDPADAPEVAVAFAGLSSARTLLLARVRAMFSASAGDARRADPAVLAPLLTGYGSALAEVARGGSDRRERVPFVAGARHPSAAVRAAAAGALRGLLARLFEFAEHERADAILAALADEGLPRHELLYRRATLALTGRGAAEDTLVRAIELEHVAPFAPPEETSVFGFYAKHLQGAARFALDDLDGAGQAFREGEALLEELLRERLDRMHGGLTHVGGALMVDRLQLLALERTWRALTMLAKGSNASDPIVVELMRSVHEILLRASVLMVQTDADALGAVSSIDALFDRDLAPGPLVLFSGKVERFNDGRGLGLLAQLGAVLATVAPYEVAGFGPATEPYGPLRDPARLELMHRFRTELEGKFRRDLNRFAGDEAAQAMARNRLFGLAQGERDEEERLRALGGATELTDAQLLSAYDDLVARSSSLSLYGLTLATQLRTHGSSAEARALGERMLEQLHEGLPGANSLSTEWASARIELMIGSAYMDEDLAEDAERVSLSAVRRLEELENTFINQGSDPSTDGTIALLRAWRATALLSLAVNANVRMGDTERALTYFERAFELDQRDFMQVLRACYRARSGREREARAVLRNVQPSPTLYYNLACTYALLGDTREALDFLRREFDENHPTAGSRRRQMEWARSDPDLANLRSDPGFRRLVGLDEAR